MVVIDVLHNDIVVTGEIREGILLTHFVYRSCSQALRFTPLRKDAMP